MAYKKYVWKSKDRITKEKLNNIEEGIYEVHKIIGENKDLSLYQLKEDDSLLTSNKNISGAINELFQSASNGKALIAQAITGKGITTSNTDTFQTMATNISLISGKITGKILTLDNKKYTLSEDDNGNITATIIKFSITNNLTNVSNNNSAIKVDYGNSYSATITANSGYTLSSITVTMGGANITSSAVSGNSISISSVTGNVVIVAQATATAVEPTTYTITKNLTNCTSSNTTSTVNQGASYTTTIVPSDNYTLETIAVTMNGTDITDTAVNIKTDTGNATVSGESLSVSGTSSNATRYAVVNISNVTGNIVISATAVEKTSGGEEETTYTITKNLINCASSNTSNSATANSSYSATITPNSGYELLNVAITMGGTNVTSSVYTYQDGNAVINIPNVTGDVIITVQATLIVKIALSEISNMTVYKGETFNILYSSNISAVKHEISWDGGNTFYDKTSEILTENTVNYKYSHNAETEYDSFNMAIRVTDANGNTDVKYFTITFENNVTEPEETFYTVTKNLTNCSSSNNTTSITEGSSYTTNITANNGYVLSSMTVTMGGTNITSTVVDGNTINIPNVSGNIVINAIAVAVAESSDLLDSTGAYVIDDFSGSSVDRNKWDYELGYVRNGELQNYTSTNTEVSNSILALKGIKDSNGNWTASSIISKGHFAFMYGKIECRAKIDPTWGSFSAFWTLGDSFEFGYHDGAAPDTLGEWWAYCGEFDVMEFYSGRLTCGTFFNEREESGRVWYDNYDFNAWHTFAMEWLENGTLIFSIDGHELSRTNPTDNRAFHIPHFILINQAIGASGGTPADSTTAITQYVDWVKYYPASTSNVVLNSSDFSLEATDPNDSAHNCVVRPIFNDNCINKSLTWSSSDSSLVWIHSGLCSTYAGANGTATITATSHSGVSKSITLTVTNGIIRQS